MFLPASNATVKLFMQHDPRAFLWDVRESALAIQSFVAELNSNTYASNSMAQAACERKFEIIGEALNQLSKVDPNLAAKIPEISQIIAFRNQLIHGYAKIKASTVWTVIEGSLPLLLNSVNELLDGLGEV
jgi:uncharacterized protein with HEPN domain